MKALSNQTRLEGAFQRSQRASDRILKQVLRNDTGKRTICLFAAYF
jgi:hypothetical protein